MAIREHKSWQELCHAALEAKDPNELQEIVRELNKASKHEEQVRRDFGEAAWRQVLPVNSTLNNGQQRTNRYLTAG